MTSAAMTPGTHPHKVSRNVMVTEPHPWSTTANGGNMIHRMTRRQDIRLSSKMVNDINDLRDIGIGQCRMTRQRKLLGRDDFGDWHRHRPPLGISLLTVRRNRIMNLRLGTVVEQIFLQFVPSATKQRIDVPNVWGIGRWNPHGKIANLRIITSRNFLSPMVTTIQIRQFFA